MAWPADRWLGAEQDAIGRVRALPDLSIPGLPNVFLTGDTVHVAVEGDWPLPSMAPVANQQGRYVTRLIEAGLRGGKHARPFRYCHLGNLATIGRSSAVADFGVVRLRGYLAWLLWGAAHVFFLIGFRNKVTVALNWLWLYITFQRSMRSITGPTR